MIAGRVESRITIPSGGAAFSASNGAQSAAQALTLPAANYYWTAAGGVSGLCATLQQYLNDNVQGYPQTPAALKAAVGWANWTCAWLLNEASGNPAAIFGGTALTASGVTYLNAGPQAGIDKAIGFDTNTDTLNAGDNFDAGANDIAVALIVKFGAAGTFDIMGKGYPAGGPLMVTETPGNLGRFVVNDGVNSASAQALVDVPTGVWLALIGVLDRSTNKLRFGWRRLDGTASSVSAEASTALVGALNNASGFIFGNNFYGAHTSMQIAYSAVAVGASACTGLSANLAQALTNLCSAVSSQWSVSLDTTTGRATISNSFWPSSVAFTNTTLRSVLGFEYDFDYPQTPAQMTVALGGYGNFADGAGYLCNEAAGSLSPVFGAGTFAAVSTPTYSNPGPRGPLDTAIGFDSVADAFSGGDVRDADATSDLFLLWVSYVSSTSGVRDMFSKYAANPGWFVIQDTASSRIDFRLRDGVLAEKGVYTTAIPTGEWVVCGAVLDRSTAKARLGTYGLRTGTSTVGAEVDCTGLGTLANAASLLIGAGSITGNGPETNMKIAALYVASGVGVATGLSANLQTALTSFAAYMKGQTSTKQARALWLPDCQFTVDGDPKRAPLVSDLRQSMSPTGYVLGLVGNTFKRQRNAGWSHVPIGKAWEREAAIANASWEWFYKETQLGLGGTTWFVPNSPVQIYNENNDLVGIDDNNGIGTAGWSMTGIRSIELRRSEAEYTGFWRVEIPQLIAVGG